MTNKKPMLKYNDDPKNHCGNILEHIDQESPILVYFNLHKKTWSIKQKTVRLHTDYICLKNVEFKVSTAGRERVLRERKKNVHAFVKGFICTPSEINQSDMRATPVRYNPYLFKSFVGNDNSPVNKAAYVDMMALDRDSVLAFRPT